MPTKQTIPARTETICRPCQYHKVVGSFRGHDTAWDDCNCLHPHAYDDVDCILTPGERSEVAAVRKELDAITQREGRSIGRTERQPEWCPLKRKMIHPLVLVDDRESGGVLQD